MSRDIFHTFIFLFQTIQILGRCLSKRRTTIISNTRTRWPTFLQIRIRYRKWVGGICFTNEYSRVIIRFLLVKLNIFQYISSTLFIVTTGSSGMKKETEKDNLKDDMDFSTNTVIWRLWTIQQILMPVSMPRVLVYLNILIKLY